MTIRRRLFISNILMIVLPVLICAVVVGGFSYLVMGALGIVPNGHDGLDLDFVQDASIIANDWTANSTALQIETSLIDVIEDFPETGAALVIYKDAQQIFTLGDAAHLISESSTLTDDYTFFTTTVTVGAYTLAGVRGLQTSQWIEGGNFTWRVGILALFMFGLMITVIAGVNLFLTRMNFRHIMQPLSALTGGVRQIAEGNLSYRIAYQGKDEFALIINDFNDMTNRLQAMVTARQKDEESRRELIAGISHDLRTPLTSIIGYVEGLEKGVASTPAKQTQYLSIIHEQAETLSHTINQLFLFTKLDTDSFPMRIERIDLAAELHAYVETVCEAYAEKGLVISLALPEGLPPIQTDRVQLRNVLTNILENSVKYGGNEYGRMEIRCFADAHSVVITLADNGPGVSSASLDKLFTVFYRGDTSRRNIKEGSGLGLAISARIIQRLGGTIAAENAEPRGLLIRMTLPIIEEDDRHA